MTTTFELVIMSLEEFKDFIIVQSFLVLCCDARKPLPQGKVGNFDDERNQFLLSQHHILGCFLKGKMRVILDELVPLCGEKKPGNFIKNNNNNFLCKRVQKSAKVIIL
jgi:hypothetical protein